MNTRYPFLLLIFCLNTVWADFSNTKMLKHPLHIDTNEPFVLDLKGEWPTDCHPGEQKPVITGYTGDTLLIEFEIIVEHVTCNDVATPYRVLVDVSDVIDDVPGVFPIVDVTIRFGGAELNKQLIKVCLLCDPAPSRDIKPEPGLYDSDGLQKQGLLLARQNQRMAVYPLIYDAAGSSEWVFGGDGIVEDVYFAELYELSGGQCLGCPPPADPPMLDVIGKITLLMDSQGLVQMKVNDGLFMAYEQSDFGYGRRNVGGHHPTRSIPDLSGRWAVVDSNVTPSQSLPSEISVIPLVFDISVESVTVVPPSVIGTPPPLPGGNVIFSIRDIEGTELAHMQCDYNSDLGSVYDEEMACEVYNPYTDDLSILFEVKPLSLERLSFEWAGPVDPEIRNPKLIAVRID